MAEQFTSTHGLLQRREWLWMERAIISLPVPVSPTINTAAGWHATCSTSFITRFKASLRTIWPFRSHGLLTAVDTGSFSSYHASWHITRFVTSMGNHETSSSHRQLKKLAGWLLKFLTFGFIT